MKYTKLEDLDKTESYVIKYHTVPTMTIAGELIRPEGFYIKMEYNNQWHTVGDIFNFIVRQDMYSEIYTKEEMPEYFL